MVFIMLSLCSAEPQQASQSFKLEMSLSRTQVLTIEPIQALVSLQNKSEKAQVFKSSLIFAVFYHREGETKWEPFDPCGPTAAPMVPQTISFRPGEAINGQFFFLDVSASGEPVFNQPGEYWLKAVFHDLDIESSPQKVQVIAPVGKDAEAYGYLLQHRLYKYFTLQPGGLVLAKKSDNPVQGLTDFVEKYNESKYADYAIYALGILNLHGLTIEKNLQQGEARFREVIERQNSPVAEWANYSLAVSSRQHGDMQIANGLLEGIIAKTKNPVLKAMSEDRLK